MILRSVEINALILPLAMWVALGPGRAAAADLSPDRQREILQDALRSFDQAVAVTHENSARAAELYRQAAAGFESLLEHGIQNPALEYNAANAYMRLGDLGRAVLHYRRAHRMAPGDPRINANLNYARGRVAPALGAAGPPLWHSLFFWHRGTSPRARFWFAAFAGAIGWALLAGWLRWRRMTLLTLGTAGVLIEGAASASLLWQMNDERRSPDAVILTGQLVLRLGKGEGYDPAFMPPLGPGVEIEILNQSGEWVEAHLPGGQTGWLPASAVERI